MLRFTPQQEAYVKAVRAMHINQHEDMAARFGLAGLQANEMAQLNVNAAPLPRDVWAIWDKEFIEIQRTTLAVFNDLAQSVSTPMALGKLLHYFAQVGDSGEAHISLDGRSKARTDQPEFSYVGTPLPIIDSTYKYGWRQMLAAQTEGVELDAAGRVNAQRRVAEKLESISLVGDPQINVGGSILYGLTNHPQRNTRSTGVTLATATGAQWVAEIVATIKLLHGDNFRGRPVTIYLNWDDWFYASQAEYVANYPKKILAAVQEVAGIVNIVPSNSVPANTIIALVKSKDVVQVLNGMPPTTRAQARTNPEDDYIFVSWAAAAVELRYDSAGNMGLAVSS